MILYRFLFEVALDDYETGRAIKLDKNGAWYIDRYGKFLRHAKILFKTHSLQRKLIKDYRLHDPTKVGDKCIEVLLGKLGGKYRAISTLRKLDAKCMTNHKETYAVVPKSVLVKAIKISKSIPDKDKQKLIKIVDKIKKLTNVKKKKKKDKPIIISTPDDVKKLK